MTATVVRSRPGPVDPTLARRRSCQRLGPARWPSALILAQLGLRAWASFGSWWVGDDFTLHRSRCSAPGGRSLTGAARPIRRPRDAGRLVPVLAGRPGVAPFDYAWPAAVAPRSCRPSPASGSCACCWSGFGRRWGIVPPLVLYARHVVLGRRARCGGPRASRRYPLQIALLLGDELPASATCGHDAPRSASRRSAWVARRAWSSTRRRLLVIGALGIVTVAYFTRGTARAAAAPALAHLPGARSSAPSSSGSATWSLYVALRPQLQPHGRPPGHPIGPTADVMVLRGWGPAIVGGPLSGPRRPGRSHLVRAALDAASCWSACVADRALRAARCAGRGPVAASLLLPGFFLGLRRPAGRGQPGVADRPRDRLRVPLPSASCPRSPRRRSRSPTMPLAAPSSPSRCARPSAAARPPATGRRWPASVVAVLGTCLDRGAT